MLEGLAARAAEGEGVAREVVRRPATYLGAAIGSLVNILSPEVLVLGNQVAAHLGERQLNETRAARADHPFAQPMHAVTLRLSFLPRGAVRGAAAFAFQGFSDDRDAFGPVSRTPQGRAARQGRDGGQ
ncbi:MULTISPECIES: ROK family protein [unclassified Streptomyces]|uniref:ROK family protein n=1 Tax=Streptomyces sp. NPDC127129 TaxID=3345373 RepID=UPI00364226AA